MIEQVAIGFVSIAVICVVIDVIGVWFAGRSETHSRVSISRTKKGLPGKASRAVEQLQRSISCLFGFHRYVVNCDVPVGTRLGRCAWCGKPGLGQKTP